ncbi:MAG: hypothetical protein ICV63_04010 [Coleofasciculus sp. Co-bin14]|nr:hypothetical protein [Coleofasciculus sp. Co-bin14]MBD0385931.1 hypothetical protein [Nostoc sp. C3-bin3]
MATIAISNLHPTGSALFLDAESFLNELDDEEANLTYGGEAFIRPFPTFPTRPYPTRPYPTNPYPTKPFPTTWIK